MKMVLRNIIVFLLVGVSVNSFSQERVTTFGIQLKPIIPLGFFDTGKQEQIQNNITFSLNPKLGLGFGMVIRKGFTKSLSIETGINWIRRNYDLTISDVDSNFAGTSSFKMVNYEVPILGLVYVQLGNNLFMNVSGGASFDIYPSDLRTFDNYFTNDLLRYSWIRTSLLANIGWEYRTEKKGYFYLGASLHRPFSKIFGEFVTYDYEELNRNETVFFDLSGNYITLDLRYFFHEEKLKKRKKKKKEPKNKFKDPRK
jgi:hypothetical protein